MKNVIKQTAGSFAATIMPQKCASLSNGKPPSGAWERLINSALIKQAAQEDDHQTLRSQLASYWQGDSGVAFYDTFEDRFERNFLTEHYAIIEQLAEIIEVNPNQYSQLLEIGCGNGAVLNHLADKFDFLTSFIGIDINRDIIERNRQFYDHPKMKFEAGDAMEVMTKYSNSGTILLTYGGVFEYFLETELLNVFRSLKEQSPSLIVMVEPLYEHFDLEKDFQSKSGGAECSFSHNYPHLVQKSGFEVICQTVMTDEFSWLMMIAKG